MLGVAFGVAVAIGNTIGSGILRTPGEIRGAPPIASLFLGVWVAGGVYAFLSSLSIAELGTMVPRAGGQYAFARRALGDYAGFVVGYGDWLSTCGSTAAAALVIGEYLALLVPALRGSATVLAVGVTVLFALLQLRGVRLSGRVQEVTSLVKTLAFAALILACFVVGHPAAAAAPAPGACAAGRAGPRAAGGDLHLRRLDRADLLLRGDRGSRPRTAARAVLGRRPDRRHLRADRMPRCCACASLPTSPEQRWRWASPRTGSSARWATRWCAG